MAKDLEDAIKAFDGLLVERREHYVKFGEMEKASAIDLTLMDFRHEFRPFDGFKYMTAGGQTARYRVERSDSEGAIRTSYFLEEVTHG